MFFFLFVFSRLDCVYGMQSNMLMLNKKIKKRTLFFTLSIFILPRSVHSPLNAPIISRFYEAPPSEIRDGLRLVSWPSVL